MKRGFTLIELLVVIMIILVIAGFIVSAMGKVFEGSHKVDAYNAIKRLYLGVSAYRLECGGWPAVSTSGYLLSGKNRITDHGTHIPAPRNDTLDYLGEDIRGRTRQVFSVDKALMSPGQHFKTDASAETVDGNFMLDPWEQPYGLLKVVCCTHGHGHSPLDCPGPCPHGPSSPHTDTTPGFGLWWSQTMHCIEPYIVFSFGPNGMDTGRVPKGGWATPTTPLIMKTDGK